MKKFRQLLPKEEEVRVSIVWVIVKAYCIKYFNQTALRKFYRHMRYSILVQGQCDPLVEHEEDQYIYIDSQKEIDDILKIIQKGKPNVKTVPVRRAP